MACIVLKMISNSFSMLSRNEIKYIQSLSRKKVRAHGSIFIAEGVKTAKEILHRESTIEIKKIYALPHWENELNDYKSVTNFVSEKELAQLSGLNTPNEILILAEKKENCYPEVISQGLVLVLDGIQDPGNMGTIIRTADWFGFHHIVAGIDCVDIYNPKVVQSTMGSIIRVDVEYVSLDRWLMKQHLPVYGAVLTGSNINEIEPLSDAILLIGREGKGIQENLKPMITQPITISGVGKAESLNAAVAAGILMAWLRSSF